MMLLTNESDESIIVSLDDDTEIEITVIEMEGVRSRVVVCAEQSVDLVRRYLTD